MDVDRGRAVVAGAGAFVGFLDAVAVVAGAFDRARAAAVAPFGVDRCGDLGQDVGQGVVSVLRGKNPPYRWRYGGRYAGPG